MYKSKSHLRNCHINIRQLKLMVIVGEDIRNLKGNLGI